jgi:hypothetical protein
MIEYLNLLIGTDKILITIPYSSKLDDKYSTQRNIIASSIREPSIFTRRATFKRFAWY